MGTCKLCLLEKKLSGSHIIPKSFLKQAKKGDSQIIKMVPESTIKPRLDNANWNTPLLCAECETFINTRYETSQLQYLKNKKTAIRHPKRVTFEQFDFNRFYLFWLSILWRASVTDMEEFKSVQLGAELNEMIRILLLSESTRYKGQACISDFIRIGIVRLLPGAGFTEELLKLIVTTFIRDTDGSGESKYYVLLGGFLVGFQLTANPSSELPREFGRIKQTFNFRMPAFRIDQLEWATDMFNKLIAYSRKNAEWRD